MLKAFRLPGFNVMVEEHEADSDEDENDIQPIDLTNSPRT